MLEDPLAALLLAVLAVAVVILSWTVHGLEKTITRASVPLSTPTHTPSSVSKAEPVVVKMSEAERYDFWLTHGHWPTESEAVKSVEGEKPVPEKEPVKPVSKETELPKEPVQKEPEKEKQPFSMEDLVNDT